MKDSVKFSELLESVGTVDNEMEKGKGRRGKTHKDSDAKIEKEINT